MLLRLVGIGVLCCVAGTARGDEQRDEEARRLFQDGRAAFEKSDYQRAFDAFRKSYLISERPALLFNMSSALKELGRPHEAADELRAYLRLVPDATDRVQIEQRILALEESQRILDRERARKTPVEPPAEPAPAPMVTEPATPAPVVATPVPTANPLTAPTPEKPKRKLGLAIGLGVGGAVIVGALAVGLGVGLSHGSTPSPTSSTFGTIRATP